MTVGLRIVGADGTVKGEVSGRDEAILVYRAAYADGDVIEVTGGPCLTLALDDAMSEAMVLLPDQGFRFPVPWGLERKAYSPKAFSGELHRLTVRASRSDEIDARRNLAFNPYDRAEFTAVFPHATATAETPQAAMAARCAIDGESASNGHGRWPHTSWGINGDPTAALTVRFGGAVEVEAVTLRLRADFPHDAWWERASLSFSDGEAVAVTLAKTGEAQHFDIGARRTEWVCLHDLIKADDPSPFPALTLIEVWGRRLA